MVFLILKYRGTTSLYKADLSDNGKIPILYHYGVYQSKSIISSCFLERDIVVNIMRDIFISFQVSFWKSSVVI